MEIEVNELHKELIIYACKNFLPILLYFPKCAVFIQYLIIVFRMDESKGSTVI